MSIYRCAHSTADGRPCPWTFNPDKLPAGIGDPHRVYAAHDDLHRQAGTDHPPTRPQPNTRPSAAASPRRRPNRRPAA